MALLKAGKEPLDALWVNRNKVSLLHLCAMRNELPLVRGFLACKDGSLAVPKCLIGSLMCSCSSLFSECEPAGPRRPDAAALRRVPRRHR